MTQCRCFISTKKTFHILLYTVCCVGLWTFWLWMTINEGKNNKWEKDAKDYQDNTTSEKQKALLNSAYSRKFINSSHGKRNGIPLPHTLNYEDFKTDDNTANNMARRICTIEERQAFIKEMCSKMDTSRIHLGKSLLSVERRRKLLYCIISKASCTTWKGIWENSNINGNNTDNVPHGSNVHHRQFLNKGGLQDVVSTNWWKTYSDYTKFIVVRHPLERVLSSFHNIKQDRVGNLTNGPFYMRDHLNKVYNLGSDFTKLTLAQFIETITSESYRGYNDQHWMPISESCNLCGVNFDYVIRTETMGMGQNSDAMPLLQYLGYKVNILININLNPSEKQIQTGLRQTYVGAKDFSEFKDVSTTLMQKLLEKYKYDMLLLGYGYDEFSYSGSCSIRSSKHDVCC